MTDMTFCQAYAWENRCRVQHGLMVGPRAPQSFASKALHDGVLSYIAVSKVVKKETRRDALWDQMAGRTARRNTAGWLDVSLDRLRLTSITTTASASSVGTFRSLKMPCPLMSWFYCSQVPGSCHQEALTQWPCARKPEMISEVEGGRALDHSKRGAGG